MICKTCGEDKEKSGFPKNRKSCLNCFREDMKKYRPKKKIIHKTENGVFYKTCTVCKELKSYDQYEECTKNQHGIRTYCKKCGLDKIKNIKINGPKKAYPHTNVDGIICKKCTICFNDKPLSDFSPLKKCWDQLHTHCKKCRTENQQKYAKNKYHNDPVYKEKELKRIKQTKKRWSRERADHRIRTNLSRRIRRAMMGLHKSEATMELLGCSLSEFIEYIENQFDEKMKWENYGKDGWELDHIIPCANFNLENPDEQKKCFHYTNLQPLWHTDNLSKGAKLDWQKVVKDV